LPEVVIVIPTFNPSQLLLNTLQDICDYEALASIKKIVVNDGSIYGIEYIEIAKKKFLVEIIEHSVNKGKGAGIKTAVAYIEKLLPDIDYIITMDSDHQHLGKDVIALLDSINKHGTGLHIGARKLAKDKTPLRSFIGNLFSRKFFYSLYRIELQDTQSGLRAYPKSFFSALLRLRSHRFEFEMEAIIVALLKKIQIYETPIETVYINKNRSSHFRPLVDSFKVIWVIIRMKILK